MKKILILLSIVFFVVPCLAGTRVVEKPGFEFTKTGVVNIAKIEADRKATRLYLHHTFLPGWWVYYDKSTYIEDAETGTRYEMLYLEGADMGSRIIMPASGESMIVAVFPPLDRKVSKLNFVDGDHGTTIWGISISNKNKDKEKKQAEAKYDRLYQWVASQVGEYTPQPVKSFTSPDFFERGTARIVGFINGYDRRAGFSTGIIYIYGLLGDNSQPTVIDIDEQGKFSVEVPLDHPAIVPLWFGHHTCEVYLEQGATVGMIIDWEDFLLANRYRNKSHKFTKTKYMGSLGYVNNDIMSLKTSRPDYDRRQQLEKDNSWEAVQYAYLTLLEKNLRTIENAMLQGKISQDARDILRMIEFHETAIYILDYEMDQNWSRINNSRNSRKRNPPILFYDFLKDIPLTDPGFLIPMDWVFFNRFEFMSILRCPPEVPNSKMTSNVSFTDYLSQETDAALGKEYAACIDHMDSINKKLIEPDETCGNRYSALLGSLSEKYPEHWQKYLDKYFSSISQANIMATEIAYEDSVYYNVLELHPSFVYDIVKARKLGNIDLKSLSTKEQLQIREQLMASVKHRSIKNEITRICDKAMNSGHTAEELRPCKGTDILRSVTDQFKGKLVFIDFWATSCGPCIGGIKSSKDVRQQLEAEGDVVFVFITDEKKSPEKPYQDLVATQELTHTFRVSSDEWNYLTELFEFSGVPHYRMLDRNGNLITEGLPSLYNLKEYIEKYK